MKRAIAVGILVLLIGGGCLPKDPPLPPVISDIAESVVKVEAQNPRGWHEWPTEGAINRMAQRGCAKYNRVADRISWKCKAMDEGGWEPVCVLKEYLFACKPK